ncbi:hypothetical protein K438DRAFT_2024530 [Mycena galopus ATCC 62051]|nr:hypothetical protein K438DRAFT_2024530 [Mycena galopus ATCC 62051]
MSSLPPIPPDIGKSTAPELFGMLFNYGLMGSLLVQVYHYYLAFPKDRTSTKVIVYTLFVLEVAQTGIMSYFAYTVFGSGYGNLDVFQKSALEWFPVCILGSVIAGTVQLFYAYRLRAFSGSWIASGIVTFLALLQIGSGIGQGVISEQLVDRSKLTGKPICVTIWLVSTALCDVLIAGFMSYYVRWVSNQARSWPIIMQLKRDRIKSIKMRNFISKLVRYTVETGAITALVAVIQVVVQHAYPSNNYFETPSWTLGKLYSNNLLVLLNARAVTVGGRDYINSTVRGLTEEINFDATRTGRRARTAGTELDERSGPTTRSNFNHSEDVLDTLESSKTPPKYPSSRTSELDDASSV